MDTPTTTSINGSEIAIIGLSGRFPGAKNIDEFWQNLQNGVESITFFTDKELLDSGIDPSVVNQPNYVKAKGVLEDVELFDASFFSFNPREAEITDPQHRLFLECAWEALENAGYNETYSGAIGVYAGASLSGYLFNVYSNQNILSSVDPHQIAIGGDKDYLSTRVSYKLNLEGPSYTVQTACSTSLVAVHLGCQSLLNGECDMALAGGVRINSTRKHGYFYKEGGIASPDGHCRAFDAQAQGTVSGEGVGIVVLKRLEDAIADGDCIHAVIKGSAINNDGSSKVSYTAPRIDTQAQVIRMAQGVAEVEPETITYIEAHGTGTSLGDPIEIAALTQAFRVGTEKKGFCAIGSVKTNIGHLDAAAGVTGLMKTVLALKHKKIPPSLHFEQPNPQIDFASSPFYVNTTLSDWQTNGIPRRAGVSSFGIGGTNAHVILEEAPTIEARSLADSRPWQLLLLSAKTRSALETATANLANYLQQHPNLHLADVAYTLGVGRRAFDYRRTLICQNLDDAVTALTSPETPEVFTHYQKPCHRSVVFMFPGQGSQYIDMGRELYQTEAIFRQQVDECCELLKPHLGLDLRDVLYPNAAQTQQAAQQVTQTAITQPALFVIEYALAKLWMAWGVLPTAMIGHSIGEYVAACLAGVFSLKDALALVAVRGRLMQQLPSGTMLAVSLSESKLQPLLGEECSLAASNAPSLCVVSGAKAAIEKLQQQLGEQGVDCRPLHTSHAFHSQMMNPIIDLFTEHLRKINLKELQIPFVSNVTGTWMSAAQATDPSYWAKHLRHTVRFAEGIAELLQQPQQIFLEVGAGRTLSTLVRQHPQQEQHIILSSLRHPKEQQSDVAFLLNAVSRLWLNGVKINWSSFYATERRERIPLPTYPFERQRYWIEPQSKAAPVTTHQEPLHKKPDIADWFYVPIWKQSIPLKPWNNEKLTQKLCWLVFVDNCGLGAMLAQQLEQLGQDVITVIAGDQFTKLSEHAYCINPQQKNDYDTLLQNLGVLNKTPQMIAHFWSITVNNQTASGIELFETSQAQGFYSLLFLAQALGQQSMTDALQILVVTNNMYNVTGAEKLSPEKTTVLGLCKVIGQEYPNISCRSIDIVIPPTIWQQEKLIEQLLAELTAQPSDSVVAYRGYHRWVQTFEAVRLEDANPGKARLRQGGVYLITGGLGGIGLTLAQYLAQTVQAKLVLISRSGLPERGEWEKWLTTHDDQDSVSNKIRKVQALEELGTEVLVKSADVADLEQMQALMSEVFERFGDLHGVIHAAGIVGEKAHTAIQETSLNECHSQFQSKVYGLFVLEKVLQGRKLDFCLLLSSLASVLGGLGFVAYSAANLFMDAFAHKQNQTNPVPWISVNWDGWQLREKEEQNTAYRTTLAELAIRPSEGVEAFQRILSTSTVNQVVVSTGSLQARIEQWLKLELLKEKLEQTSLSKPLHSRPQLGNDYVAPRSSVEQIIADIWQNLLGIEQIGIHDNFFELGGHSLLATQVTSQLRKTFLVELPLRSLFSESSTIAQLGEQIEQLVMEKIEQLSEEDAQRLLGV
ncbi:type I polyketide synthase [Mastigocladopsis repens]|uniref:type I polyketide synthase n=1 Tax=Mastigocladopsis repens TaxID=221287 RepID=UPI0003038211|nr:type I polyketide synthase [Mastigocladopsis repens]